MLQPQRELYFFYELSARIVLDLKEDTHGKKEQTTQAEPFKCCETCANMQPIGEGDHICDACCSHDGSPTALVLESYIPADDYFICEGSRWTPQ